MTLEAAAAAATVLVPNDRPVSDDEDHSEQREMPDHDGSSLVANLLEAVVQTSGSSGLCGNGGEGKAGGTTVEKR